MPIPMRRNDLPPDAAVHARARAVYASHEAPPRQERGRGCGVCVLALRSASKPRTHQTDVQSPGRADVQSKRRRGLAIAAESGDVSHAQLRLRSSAAPLADISDLSCADRRADGRHSACDPQV